MLGEAGQTQVRMNLKLLIDTESKRVLFAEAGKDFVDFLFKIQTLPVGTVVVSLLQKKTSKGIGFVKDMVNYMMMDDLVLMPLSTISSITFLNKLDVKNFSTVREKRVDFGMDKAVKLLSASLHTNNVLTDVFLNGTTSTSKKASKVTTRLELLIDTNGKRVLHAESGKEFADFLFQILSLPLATVVSLLRKQDTFGSLSNLYESMENLNDSYMQYNGTKDSILKLAPVVNVSSAV
ncbi:hypothetical protein MIMGU_mgv11b020324mg, partial [Erythranthe guttata]